MLPMLATTINDGRMVNRVGLSRKHVFDAVQNSVKRLGTYIDVLQIHRMDRDVPHEEIMRALNDVIEQGWVRYIGASSVSKAFLFCTSHHGSSINTPGPVIQATKIVGY